MACEGMKGRGGEGKEDYNFKVGSDGAERVDGPRSTLGSPPTVPRPEYKRVPPSASRIFVCFLAGLRREKEKSKYKRGDRVRVCYKRRLPSLPARNGLLLCHGTPVPDLSLPRRHCASLPRKRFRNAATHTRKRSHTLHTRRCTHLPRSRSEQTPHDRAPSRRRGAQGHRLWQRLRLGGEGRKLRGDRLGIERWSVFPSYSTVYRAILTGKCRTDGMRWSPSRVRDVRALSFHFCLFP